MDRLFLTVYVKLALAVALAALLAQQLVVPGVKARVARNIEETLSPPLALSAEMLGEQKARGSDMDAVFARAALRFRTPTAILRMDELRLDREVFDRVLRGEVVQTGDFLQSVLYVRIRDTDRVLRTGPLNPIHPFGEGRSWMLMSLIVAGLLAGVYLVLRPIRRRLATLSRAAEALGRGDLAARAEMGPDDAIGRVARVFNHMVDEVARVIASQKELLYMVSHELRTPLQRLHFNLEALRSTGDERKRELALTRMERDVDELDELLTELLTYVRLGDIAGVPRERVPIEPLLAELCETLAEVAGKVTLAFRGAPSGGPLAASIDAHLVRRAVANLVVNALRYARSRVEVSVTRQGEALFIDVDDDGPGIPEEAQKRVFEPFQRLDDERTWDKKCFGLGLSIVRRVAELHGGDVAVLTSGLGGARLRLTIPILPGQSLSSVAVPRW